MNLKKCLIIFFLFSLFNISCVNAASKNHNLVYGINSFNLTAKNELEIGGWAFIDHVDTIGGENETIFIVASVKDNWKISQCSDNSKVCRAYKIDKNEYKKYNFYGSRQIESGGEEPSLRNRLLNKKMEYRDYCDHITKEKSNCVYYNAGFLKKIALKPILKQFSGVGSNVDFYIYVETGYGSTNPKKWKYFKEKISLGVPAGVCNDKLKCNTDSDTQILLNDDGFEFTDVVDGKTVTYIYDKITLKKLSNKVYFTAKSARPGTSINSSGKKSGSESFYPQSPKYYYLATGVTNKNVIKGISRKNGDYGTKSYMIKINRSSSVSCGFDRVNESRKCYGPSAGPNKGTTYSIRGTWARLEGKLSIKLKEKPDKEEEENYSGCMCVGDACEVGKCPQNIPSPKNCEIGETSNLEGCHDQIIPDSSCIQRVSNNVNKYYYKADVGKMDANGNYPIGSVNWAIKQFGLKSLPGCENGGCTFVKAHLKRNGGIYSYGEDLSGNVSSEVSDIKYYYIPVKFYSDIRLNQGAKLEIRDDGAKNNINDKTPSKFYDGIYADAGRYFHYSLAYDVHASWDYETGTSNGEYLNKVSSNNTDYKTWIEGSNIQIHVEYKKSNENVVTKVDVSVPISIGLSDFSAIYGNAGCNCDISKNNVPASSLKKFSFSDLYKSVADDNTLLEDNLDKDESLELTAIFPSSNNLNDDVLQPGDFVCNTSKDNKSVSKSCEYNIRNVYMDVAGNKYYCDEEDDCSSYTKSNNAGSIYYIPFGMKSGDVFKFSVDSDKLSLISKIDYSYHAVCNVKVKAPLKDKLTYRPISSDNPFPNSGGDKTKLPLNWYKYVGNLGFSDAMRRISLNTYDDNSISYKTSVLNAKYFNKFDFGYNNIKKEFNNDSSIVIDNNDIRRNSVLGKNRCAVGEWKATCDIKQGGDGYGGAVD